MLGTPLGAFELADGDREGVTLGMSDGDLLGGIERTDGNALGIVLGLLLGIELGAELVVGVSLGSIESSVIDAGALLGRVDREGPWLGDSDGDTLGAHEGDKEGSMLGTGDGIREGIAVGN